MSTPDRIRAPADDLGNGAGARLPMLRRDFLRLGLAGVGGAAAGALSACGNDPR
jgi:hypothetical protein